MTLAQKGRSTSYRPTEDEAMKVLPTMGSMYSGSMRGITASHNKGGLYFRGRTVPTNPNTARQQTTRSAMNGKMQDWSMVLTEAQRQAWRDYAANVPVTDSLGQTMNLSGINWFVKSQSLPAIADAEGLQGIGTVVTNAAPVIFNTGEAALSVTTFEGVFTTPPGTVTVAGSLDAPASDDGLIFLFIAPPQTAGVRFYKGPYQLAAVAALSPASAAFSFTAVDLADPTEWVSDTVPVAGWDGLFVPLRLVCMYADGRRSEEWRMLIEFTDATP
jgi:hypothetical protein